MKNEKGVKLKYSAFKNYLIYCAIIVQCHCVNYVNK